MENVPGALILFVLTLQSAAEAIIDAADAGTQSAVAQTRMSPAHVRSPKILQEIHYDVHNALKTRHARTLEDYKTCKAEHAADSSLDKVSTCLESLFSGGSDASEQGSLTSGDTSGNLGDTSGSLGDTTGSLGDTTGTLGYSDPNLGQGSLPRQQGYNGFESQNPYAAQGYIPQGQQGQNRYGYQQQQYPQGQGQLGQYPYGMQQQQYPQGQGQLSQYPYGAQQQQYPQGQGQLDQYQMQGQQGQYQGNAYQTQLGQQYPWNSQAQQGSTGQYPWSLNSVGQSSWLNNLLQGQQGQGQLGQGQLGQGQQGQGQLGQGQLGQGQLGQGQQSYISSLLNRLPIAQQLGNVGTASVGSRSSEKYISKRLAYIQSKKPFII